MRLPSITALSPSSTTAWSSSARASSGVCIGITAAGVMRSANGAKVSAEYVLNARQVARRSPSSATRTAPRPDVGYSTAKSMPSSSRRS